VLAAFSSGKYPSRTGNNLRAEPEFSGHGRNSGRRDRSERPRLHSDSYAPDDPATLGADGFHPQADGRTHAHAAAASSQASEGEEAGAGREEADGIGAMDHGVSHVVLPRIGGLVIVQRYDGVLRHAGE